MTKEERANKWFHNVAEAEAISLQTKMDICNRAATRIVIIFLALFFAEFIVLFMMDDGETLNRVADFINNMAEGSHTKARYKGIALAGVLMCAPLLIVPAVAAITYKNMYIKAEAAKVLAATNNISQTAQHNLVEAKQGQSAQAQLSQEKLSSDFLKNEYSDWTMDIDGKAQKSLSIAELKHQLASILNGATDFMVLDSTEPIQIKQSGRVCNFAQICQDEDPDYYHFELGTSFAEQKNQNNKSNQDNGIVVYGRNGLNKVEVYTLLQKLLDHRIVPNLQEWEIVVDMQIEHYTEVEAYAAIVQLMTKDATAISNLQACFESPQQYFNAHEEQFDDRGISSSDEPSTIKWLAIVDELMAQDEVVELDWKTEQEEFFEQVKPLASKQGLELQLDWLKEDGDIPIWCAVLDKKWSEKKSCVGAMDIYSDSYVLFICQREVLQQLVALGNKVGHRFDLATNM
ncbi:DUF6630 family protein [Atopobium fossor]|uniref:DUF6630 family protein n=1 Tax=Atopobium fossor TaxID=39487 RepID=UPI0004052E7C|nr:DUF6630 family protein [Atopobium fossor]